VNDGNWQQVRMVPNQQRLGDGKTLKSLWDENPEWWKE
jgi:hypothetical protein